MSGISSISTHCISRTSRVRPVPSTFAIWDDTLGADFPATQHRHARHQALFYERLDVYMRNIEFNFLALVVEWAASLAPAAPSATTYTRADFTDFFTATRRTGKVQALDVARLASMLRSVVAFEQADTGRAVAPLVLGTAEQQKTCALFARALRAGEDGAGPRSGKGRGPVARGLRDWRRHWTDVLFIAMGRGTYGLVMKHAEWIVLCADAVMPDFLARIDREDWEEMHVWGMEELSHTDKLALCADFPTKL